jgi:hypothetical protein
MATNLGQQELTNENNTTQPLTPPPVAPVEPAKKDPLTGLDIAIGKLQNTIAGIDPTTEALLNRQNQTSSAQDAARKSAERQQAAQAGMTGGRAMAITAQTQRDVETSRQGGLSAVAMNAAQRADSSTLQLADLSTKKDVIEKSDYEKSVSNADLNNPEEVARLEAEGKALYGANYSLAGQKRKNDINNYEASIANADLSNQASYDALEAQGKAIYGPTFSLAGKKAEIDKKNFDSNLEGTALLDLSTEDYNKLEEQGKALYGPTFSLSGRKFTLEKDNFNNNLAGIDFGTLTPEQVAKLEAEGKRLNGSTFTVDSFIKEQNKKNFDSNLAVVDLGTLTDEEIAKLELDGKAINGPSFSLASAVKAAREGAFEDDLSKFTDWGNQAAVDELVKRGVAIKGSSFSVQDKVQGYYQKELDSFTAGLSDTDMQNFDTVWNDYIKMYNKAYPDRGIPDYQAMKSQIYASKQAVTGEILSNVLSGSVHVTTGTPLLTVNGELNTQDPAVVRALDEHFTNMMQGASMYTDSNGNGVTDESEKTNANLSYSAKEWLKTLDGKNSTQGKYDAAKNTYLGSQGLTPGTPAYTAASNAYDDAIVLSKSGSQVVRINGIAVGWVNPTTGTITANLTDDPTAKFGITTDGLGYQISKADGTKTLTTGNGEIFRLNADGKLVIVDGTTESIYKGGDAEEIAKYLNGGVSTGNTTTTGSKVTTDITGETVTVTTDGQDTTVTPTNSFSIYEKDPTNDEIWQASVSGGGSEFFKTFLDKYTATELVKRLNTSSAAQTPLLVPAPTESNFGSNGIVWPTGFDPKIGSAVNIGSEKYFVVNNNPLKFIDATGAIKEVGAGELRTPNGVFKTTVLTNGSL